MSKTYVEMSELERLFSLYAIPYTNIFDEMKTVTENEITAQMSVSELSSALSSKEEVFATQVWQRGDIEAGMEKEEIEPEEELIRKVMMAARPSLEDCSDNWDRLLDVIRSCQNK